MSKLFAFNVSETTDKPMVEGSYDPDSQLWVGEHTSVARGYRCFSGFRACESALYHALSVGCAVFQTSCTTNANNEFCYYDIC